MKIHLECKENLRPEKLDAQFAVGQSLGCASAFRPE
jgi:hypothetical protein